MKKEQIKILPISEELRTDLLTNNYKKKLDTPEAIIRRRRYRLSKPKKQRIRCLHCNKRFTPKRSTKKFCRPVCRNLYNIKEHKLFKENNVYVELFKLPIEIRQTITPIDFYRQVLAEKLNSNLDAIVNDSYYS